MIANNDIAGNVLDFRLNATKMLEGEIDNLREILNDENSSALIKVLKIKEAAHRISKIETKLAFVIHEILNDRL